MTAVVICTADGPGEGNIMTGNYESNNIDKLLAEADELIERINSDVINDMEEAYRFKFEKYIQNLNHIKSEVRGKIEKKGNWDFGSGAHGINEAIEDIVKATQEFKNYIFGSPANAEN